MGSTLNNLQPNFTVNKNSNLYYDLPIIKIYPEYYSGFHGGIKCSTDNGNSIMCIKCFCIGMNLNFGVTIYLMKNIFDNKKQKMCYHN